MGTGIDLKDKGSNESHCNIELAGSETRVLVARTRCIEIFNRGKPFGFQEIFSDVLRRDADTGNLH